jgi:hypothetical protein
MPRAYRSWMTPCVLLAAVLAAMAAAAVVGWTTDVRLQPIGTDRALELGTATLVLAAGTVTAAGGILQLLAIRPVRAHLLVRSAGLQTALAGLGPAVLLQSALRTRALLVVLLAAAAFLPALGLSGVARRRLVRYRPIPRRDG